MLATIFFEGPQHNKCQNTSDGLCATPRRPHETTISSRTRRVSSSRYRILIFFLRATTSVADAPPTTALPASVPVEGSAHKGLILKHHQTYAYDLSPRLLRYFRFPSVLLSIVSRHVPQTNVHKPPRGAKDESSPASVKPEPISQADDIPKLKFGVMDMRLLEQSTCKQAGGGTYKRTRAHAGHCNDRQCTPTRIATL